MVKATADIRSMARAHTEESIRRLAYWMRQDGNPKASVTAAIALLDRGWGKPTQPIAGDGEDGPMMIEVTWKRVEDNASNV